MSRRTQRPELDFGSDSFLDVVCNIVGILIILIVIVAVQLERQPRPAVAEEEFTEIAKQRSAVAAEYDAASSQKESLRTQLQGLQQDSAQLEGKAAKADLEKADLASRLKDAEMALQSSQEKAQQSSRQKTRLEKDHASIAARIASLEKAIQQTTQQDSTIAETLTRVSEQEKDLAGKLRTAVVETQKLEEVLTVTQQKSVPRDRLQHRLSPVTRPADANEQHYRVSNGKVSLVPLEDLLERLKAQVLSKRATIMRFNQFEGTVGPVGGYTMNYTVEKEGPSTLEALRTGDDRTRLSVSRWEIVPDVSLVEETAEEAVRPGSRFRNSLETRQPDSVVTIWIYEDSFREFSELREVAHGLQLRVAARPLPAGTPIVGSPNGSRSNAQ
ncbi:MAG: hypothetical protein U0996_05460 [Planctomycetaceae bacterium]